MNLLSLKSFSESSQKIYGHWGSNKIISPQYYVKITELFLIPFFALILIIKRSILIPIFGMLFGWNWIYLASLFEKLAKSQMKIYSIKYYGISFCLISQHRAGSRANPCNWHLYEMKMDSTNIWLGCIQSSHLYFVQTWLIRRALGYELIQKSVMVSSHC